jgi:3-hydroxybutyryl-CoA dehydratase
MVNGVLLRSAMFRNFFPIYRRSKSMKSKNAKCWQEFEVGQRVETSGRTVESGDVNLFAGLSGDFNPIHINQTYAEKGMFGERIAHGLLTLSVSSGQMNQTGMFEGTTVGFLGMDNVRFSNPVRFGDTVFTAFTVTESRASSKPGRGIVSFNVVVTNQRSETVLTYDQTLLMAGKPI